MGQIKATFSSGGHKLYLIKGKVIFCLPILFRKLVIGLENFVHSFKRYKRTTNTTCFSKLNY